MAIPEPGTVLRCAVGPCINPAEKTVSLAGYGSLFPTLRVFLCQTCFDVYGSMLMQGQPRTHIDGHGAVHTIAERSPRPEREEEGRVHTYLKELEATTQEQRKRLMYGTFLPEKDEEELPERTPTRSPYVPTGRIPVDTITRDENGISWIEGEEYAPSLITVALDDKELAHALTHFEARQLRYPDYLSVAIDRVSDELLDRLEADIRRIEAHPASNPPEPEQHAPGWLPGDD